VEDKLDLTIERVFLINDSRQSIKYQIKQVVKAFSKLLTIEIPT